MRNDLDRLVARANTDARVLAVMLFGSVARGEQRADSDFDICLFLNTPTGADATGLRLDYLSEFDLDVQVFQSLPLYVRTRVLRDGKVLLCKDEDRLYEIAIDTARRFEDFKPIYTMYLEAVARG